MDEDRKLGNDQLNTDPPSEEAGFDVEDIIAEFSGQAEAPQPPAEAPEEEQPAAEEDEDVRVWSPKQHRAEPPQEASAEPEPAAEPEDGEPAASDPEEEPEPDPEDYPAPRLLRPKVSPFGGFFRRLSGRRAQLRESLDAVPDLTDEEAKSHYLRRRNARRLPHLLSWLLTLLAALVTFLPLQPWMDLSAWLTPGLSDVVCIGVLLCQILLALPVLTVGVQNLLALRFARESYLVLTTLVTLLYGLSGLLTGSGGGSLCAVASLLLTVAQHGDDLLTAAKATSLSRALSIASPFAVIRGEARLDGRDCLSRRQIEPDGLLETAEARPPAERRIGVYCLVVVSMTFAAALFAAVRGGRNFLWAWSILLLGSCPLGAFWAYGRAFRALNKKLRNAGAVVLGWGGASRLGGSLGVIIKDEDLFPKTAVQLNGVKVFGAHSPERLLGYAAAILDRAGANTAAAFAETLELHNGKHFHTDHFRFYDAGGLGAEIQGDVVLLGSRAFLDTMGVEIPPEARVEQALYISLNHEAAGLFALRYNTSESVRSGLLSILGSSALRPILATRDALLSPETVGRLYKLQPDHLEYPVIGDRLALSEPKPTADSKRCALLARDSFLSFTSAITDGRRLCRCLRKAFAVAVIGSVIGLLLMILLALLNAEASASAANLILCHLVWLVPSLWLTSLFGG